MLGYYNYVPSMCGIVVASSGYPEMAVGLTRRYGTEYHRD
jgi:hypothetical protein